VDLSAFVVGSAFAVGSAFVVGSAVVVGLVAGSGPAVPVALRRGERLAAVGVDGALRRDAAARRRGAAAAASTLAANSGPVWLRTCRPGAGSPGGSTGGATIGPERSAAQLIHVSHQLPWWWTAP
jgi:hypothetical protein